MHTLELAIQHNVWLAWAVLLVAFFVLAKCADIFVDSAVALADRSGIPKLLIGIVLVSLATTAPELAVSMMSAIKGNPEIALGNAIGSVICDDGLALGLAGVVSAAPILVMPAVLKTSGIFLVFVEIVIFAFLITDGTLSRPEGLALVILFAGYVSFLYRMHKSGKLRDEIISEEELEKEKGASLLKLIILFIAGVAGIIIASEFIVDSAQTIAHAFHVPDAIIGLTLIAFGTSIPEAATCVAAARKNEGAIAVGNIIGADILNICWVAGASAVANNLVLGKKELYFMFPFMFVVVGTMLVLLWNGFRLTRAKGITLLAVYTVYLISSILYFPAQALR